MCPITSLGQDYIDVDGSPLPCDRTERMEIRRGAQHLPIREYAMMSSARKPLFRDGVQCFGIMEDVCALNPLFSIAF